MVARSVAVLQLNVRVVLRPSSYTLTWQVPALGWGPM